MDTEKNTGDAGNDKAVPIVPAKDNKMAKYVIIGLVVLVVLGYGARYVMGMLGMAALNAQLGSQGVQVSGNPLSGGSYTVTGKDGQTVTVNTNGQGSYNMTDEKGNTYNVGAGAKLPDGFPSSVPLYTNATVASSATSDQGGKTAYTVTFMSKDAFADIATFYKRSLSENGWKTLQDVNLSSEYSMFAAENGTLRVTAMVQGGAENKETTIAVTVIEK